MRSFGAPPVCVRLCVCFPGWFGTGHSLHACTFSRDSALPDLRADDHPVRSNVATISAQALETEKRDAEERVRDLQAKKVAELGGGEGGETDGGGAADDVDRSCTGGGGEVEVLQRELSLTLTELAKVSTEVQTLRDPMKKNDA